MGTNHDNQVDEEIEANAPGRTTYEVVTYETSRRRVVYEVLASSEGEAEERVGEGEGSILDDDHDETLTRDVVSVRATETPRHWTNKLKKEGE